MTWRISMAAPVSALWLSSAAALEPLLSIVIFSGVPFLLTALRKNLSAALQSRLAVSRKSTVAPALSTARYRYFQLPSPSRRSHPFATETCRAFVYSKFLLQRRNVFEHPSTECCVVHHAALRHHFLELTVADRIRRISADPLALPFHPAAPAEPSASLAHKITSRSK